MKTELRSTAMAGTGMSGASASSVSIKLGGTFVWLLVAVAPLLSLYLLKGGHILLLEISST